MSQDRELRAAQEAVRAVTERFRAAGSRPGLDDVLTAALAAARRAREERMPIPAALTLGDLAIEQLPAPGAVVCLVGDDDCVAYARIRRYAPQHEPHRVQFIDGSWADLAAVYRDGPAACYAVALLHEDARVQVAIDLKTAEDQRDEALYAAATWPSADAAAAAG